MMRTLSFVSMLLVGMWFGNVAKSAPLVYTGDTAGFSKQAFADPTLEANQDSILPGIAITRGDTRGIYNAALEIAFVDNFSPAGTAWAFAYNNPSETRSASNWAALTFEDWQTSLGGSTSLSSAILDGSGVLHLVDQDIYLDIRFTDWGGGGSGGRFAYNRAEITPSADFDRDGKVDGRDFLTWQRNFGATTALQSEGDADFDGTVDGDDLAIWQGAYGSPLLAVVAVPEPTTLYLAGLVLMSLASRRR